MTHAIVTGASGFIGTHLCQALIQRGDQVSALVRTDSRTDDLRRLGVRLTVSNLHDTASHAAVLSDCDVIYHLAGLTSALDHRELYRVNQQGTDIFLRSVLRHRPTATVVLVSSLAAAGPSGELPRVESSSAQPVSHYGRSKRGGELAAEVLADQLAISIVRPPIVFGEGDRNTLPMFHSIARWRIHALPGWRRRWYSLVHVSDLVEWLICVGQQGERLPADASASESGKGIYFVSSGPPIRYRQIGEMIERALGGRKVIHVPMPAASVWAVGAVASLLSRIQRHAAPMSLDKAREATAGSWACSSDKVFSQFPFRPPKSLPERFVETVKWYRENGWL